MIRKLSVIGILVLLRLFFYFYKTSGNFRKSIIAAFAAMSFYFSVVPPAHSASGADAFTQENQQHHSRPNQNREGIFSRKSNNDGSGPGKPDDSDSGGDGLPKFPQTESVEGTEERVKRINEYLSQMNEVSDSETESECDYAEQKKEIRYRIKENSGLVQASKEACKNAAVQKDVNHLEEQLAKGNENPGIGRKAVFKGVIEHRGKNGGRLYVREADGVIEILAKSGKKKSNQQFVINRLKELYG